MPAAPVLAAAVPPTTRVAHVGMGAATVGLAGLPALVTVARGGTDLSVPIVLLALGTGASLAWGADDPAEDLLAPNPVSSPVRATIRVLAVAIAAALVCCAVLGVVAVGPGLPPDLLDRAPELAAAAALALAVAFGAARHGERIAGPSGVLAGLTGPLFIAALAVRWPTLFPTVTAGPLHNRWWIVVVAGALVTIRSARDPAHR
ncbi:MAG: hypothetical protein M5U31_00400 [Acidimicrobiia bacterium]|nr:hypothetical protein [Acidimicrobiia bacterium]